MNIFSKLTLSNFTQKVRSIFKIYGVTSYAQEGEDLILNRLFDGRKEGFYVDVGAHHPKRFSNTYFFYKLGWSGINIDAMPGSMKIFNQIRPRDINIEIPVMKDYQELEYYRFNESALNGFSKELSERRNGLHHYRVIGVTRMKGAPLGEILRTHLPKNQRIDFLSIDVEGLDFEVLLSNDWARYRPKVVLVEMLTSSLYENDKNPIATFMKKNGYQIFARAINTAFFISKEYDLERKC